jgi:hypothetical protein
VDRRFDGPGRRTSGQEEDGVFFPPQARLIGLYARLAITIWRAVGTAGPTSSPGRQRHGGRPLASAWHGRSTRREPHVGVARNLSSV